MEYKRNLFERLRIQLVPIGMFKQPVINVSEMRNKLIEEIQILEYEIKKIKPFLGLTILDKRIAKKNAQIEFIKSYFEITDSELSKGE